MALCHGGRCADDNKTLELITEKRQHLVDSVKPLAEQFAFQASLFAYTFTDISDPEAIARHANGANSLHWLAAHVVTARHHVTTLLGIEGELPWNGAFEGPAADGIENTVSPQHVIREWNRITPIMMRALASSDQRLLKTAPASPFPTIEGTTLAALAILAHHEAYHIGQLGYVRRLLGKPGLVDLLVEESRK